MMTRDVDAEPMWMPPNDSASNALWYCGDDEQRDKSGNDERAAHDRHGGTECVPAAITAEP